MDVCFNNDELQNLYSDYYPRATFGVNNYKPSKEANGFFAWLNGDGRSAYSHVPRKVRVLDIGCGYCEALGYHEARGCEAYGVEADINVKDIAKAQGFKVHIGLFDPEIYGPDYFDYVTMDQVIEHVTDPIVTLKGIAKVLKTGGIAILSTPNADGWGARIFGRRWINWHAPYHLNFFTSQSMTFAAENAGLNLEQVMTITSSEWLLYQWNHLYTFPGMGIPSQFWSPLEFRGVYSRLVYLFLKLIHLTKVNHIVTHLFDALGVGDCRLYFLRKQ